ncbi:hypothetical protein [Treponema sp.]|uniref:hypothetical protein n=1 Tax=Treponema sp. TaxID=166 RepID=UPI003F1044EF
MRKHPVRKFFGLTLLYSVVIIGIFIIQFKSNSVFSKSLGSLSFSIVKLQSENNKTILKNQIRVSFNGIIFSADDKNPVTAKDIKGTVIPLALESYEEASDSVEFSFTYGARITFRQSYDKDNMPLLSIAAVPPANCNEIFLPYKISQNFSTESISPANILVTAKDEMFSFTSHSFSGGKIAFTKNDSVAKYSHYNLTRKFTFESAAGLKGTTDAEIKELCTKLRYSLVEKVQSAISQAKIDSLSETDVTAYVAELASQGKYNQAIDSIPDSFKKGNKRTYISSPFFDNLVAMSRSLSIQTEKYASLVQSNSAEVFTVEGISDYILREKKSSAVRKLIQSVSGLQKFSAFQAAGIISVYADLKEKDSQLVLPLEAVLENCTNSIQESCKLENEAIKVQKDEENFTDVYETVFIGNALQKLGKLQKNISMTQAGNLIVYSSLSETDASIRTIANIYPLIVKDNFFYPHTEILGWYGNTCVWAWTCAKSISYIHNPSTTSNIIIDFPLGLTHYVIFNGIPNFHGKIEIQSQMFRTDPRFETYNSSGYVYQAPSRLLFIKSRHKSKIELIRLFLDSPLIFESTADPSVMSVIPPAPSAPEPKPEEPSPEKTEAAPETQPEVEIQP